MATLGDAIVQFPVSGSYQPPNALMRVVVQASSASLTVLTASQTSQMVLPANPNRLGVMLRNHSPNQLYVKFAPGACDSYNFSMQLGVGGAVGSTSPFQLYTGEIHCMWDTSAAASGTLKITEFT